jgi:endonuclease III
MTKKQRYEAVLSWFQKNMLLSETELDYENDFQLLVAVILSAQCTDKRVNIITKELFTHYPDAESMTKANQETIFEYIKSCSYPNNKAKYLAATAKIITEQHNGRVPEDTELLQKMPGVGRKTAHVIAAVLFRQPKMPVDTHVFRVSQRIGLTTNAKTPLQTEKQLVKHIPKNLIPDAHHWLILHGRYICKAKSPLCHKCGIKDNCKFFEKKFNVKIIRDKE